MAFSTKRRVYTIILVLLVTCLLSAVMLFRFLPQQPFFLSRMTRNVGTGGEGEGNEESQPSTLWSMLPSASSASTVSGTSGNKAGTKRGDGAQSSTSPSASPAPRTTAGRLQKRETQSVTRMTRKVAVSVVIPVSTTVTRWQEDKNQKKKEKEKEKEKDSLWGFPPSQEENTKTKKKLVKEKPSVAAFSRFLVRLEPVLGHPYNATAVPPPPQLARTSMSLSSLVATGGATEVLLVVHVTSVETDRFATDLERLLADNLFIRVIRVFRKNVTLSDGKKTKEKSISSSEFFKNSCNMGARHARGKYLVFLSDQVFAQTGWLPEFVIGFADLRVPSTPPSPTSPAASLSPSGSVAAKPPAQHVPAQSPSARFADKQKQKKTNANAPKEEDRDRANEDEVEGGALGMLACKIVYSDSHKLQSAGLGVSLSVKSRMVKAGAGSSSKKKEPESKREDWWLFGLGNEVEKEDEDTYEDEEAREVLWYYRRLNGYARLDERGLMRRRVVGPSSYCFAISRNLFLDMGGMNDRLPLARPTNKEGGLNVTKKSVRLDPELQVLDLGLRLKEEKGLGTEYQPTVRAVMLSGDAEEIEGELKRQAQKKSEKDKLAERRKRDDGVDLLTDQELAVIEHRKNELAAVWLEDRALPAQSEVELVWDFYGGCTGWGLEAVSFITALEDHHVKISIVAGKDSFCHGFPVAVSENLARIRSRLPRASYIKAQNRIPTKLSLAPGAESLRSVIAESEPGSPTVVAAGDTPNPSPNLKGWKGVKLKEKKKLASLTSIAESTATMEPKIEPSPSLNALPRNDTAPLVSAYGGNADAVTVWMCHKPPNAYPTFPYRGLVNVNTRPDYVIGRSMTETDKISKEWVQRCNNASLVDEIWVPASFLLDAFGSSGVDKTKLRVVPIPIDVHFWDPEAVAPLETVNATLASLARQLANPFNFLSVFKWEKRKGWDLLLEAYWQEFTRRENTTLFLQTYLYGESAHAARDPENIMEHIAEYAEELGLSDKFDKDELPRIQFLTEELPQSDMPRLFKPFDAFVLPSRGEGFGMYLGNDALHDIDVQPQGMPMMEAMAMELPTIATSWSGPADFMTEENSYPIRVLKMVQASSESKARRGDEFVGSWARPDVAHLRELMREVYTNREDARRKGQQARRDIAARFSQERVAEQVAGRLSEIERLVRSRRQR